MTNIIIENEKEICVSTINVPFEKFLRCVNAAERLIIRPASVELQHEGYAATIEATYNLPTIERPEKIYGVQSLHITLKQVKGLIYIAKCFLENHPEYENMPVRTQDTAALPTRYKMVEGLELSYNNPIVSVDNNLERDLVGLFKSFIGKSNSSNDAESSKKIRVSGIGVTLKKHLFIINKTNVDTIMHLGDTVEEEFIEQGYVGVLTSCIIDGNSNHRSTQDLYVTFSQITQLYTEIQRIGEVN